MAMEREWDCPACGEPRPFYRAASTTLHLGEKTKWRCTECGFTLIRIGEISSA